MQEGMPGLNLYIFIIRVVITNRPVEQKLIHTYIAAKINVILAISTKLLIMLAIYYYSKFCSSLRINFFQILSKMINRCINKFIHI
jgi:hypothetical protein